MKIRKILIANRAEIALRIMRSAKDLGILCGVIHSSGEKEAWFVKKADETFDLGEGTLQDTYLNISKIIDIALNNGYDAIHPGYGFLSENSGFAKACLENNLIFIGPEPEHIRLMSDKLKPGNLLGSLVFRCLVRFREIPMRN